MAKKSSTRSAKTAPLRIGFRATLLLPEVTCASAGRNAPASDEFTGCTCLTLPAQASAKLPSRGMVSIKGTLNGVAFRTTLEPDGHGGHRLNVEPKLRIAAGAAVGDSITLNITPLDAADEPEPTIPTDLRDALADASGARGASAREAWSDITPIARRDWIQWITSGKRADTRVKRIAAACDMLAKGKRRPCCFDRTGGMYGRGRKGRADE